MSDQIDITCNYVIEKDFDSLANKELNIVKIGCEKCPFLSMSQKSYLNTECFKNLVKLFKNNSNLTSGIFKTIEGEFRLTFLQLDYFLDYGRQLNKIFSKMKYKFNMRLNCVKKIDCEAKLISFLERIAGNKFNEGLIITNPIESFQEISQEIKIITQSFAIKNKCQECYNQYLQFLKEIRSFLEGSKLIRKYKELATKGNSILEIYSLILGDYNVASGSSKEDFQFPNIIENFASYQVHGYKVNISKGRASLEYNYGLSSILEDSELRNIFDKIILEVKSNLKLVSDSGGIMKLDQALLSEIKLAGQLIKQEFPQLSDELTSYLAELVVFEIMKLNPLVAMLIDDEIEELFLDSPKSNIYLDHRKFGRCQTSIMLTPTEIESWKTMARIESEQLLDEAHPFLKSEIITRFFHVRISLEISPLAVDEFQMRIRKLHKKILTIKDLITNNTLSVEAAAYLLFNWFHGRCILVIGEPSSGKTTLINSLDMLGKQTWRKIYVEDVIESIGQTAFGSHQSRYQVESIPTSSNIFSSKAFQVKECLHRTPDAIFIGELIHPESVEAFFFLLKVGLRRCLATAHGETPELMVKRFIYDDHVPFMLIGNLDIVVQLRRINKAGETFRRVTRITEIKEKAQIEFNANEDISQNLSNISYNDIFIRNAEKDQLVCSFETLNDLYNESDAVKEINLLRGEYINSIRFKFEMEKIQSVIQDLLKSKIEKLEDFIKIFHQLWHDLEMN